MEFRKPQLGVFYQILYLPLTRVSYKQVAVESAVQLLTYASSRGFVIDLLEPLLGASASTRLEHQVVEVTNVKTLEISKLVKYTFHFANLHELDLDEMTSRELFDELFQSAKNTRRLKRIVEIIDKTRGASHEFTFSTRIRNSAVNRIDKGVFVSSPSFLSRNKFLLRLDVGRVCMLSPQLF